MRQFRCREVLLGEEVAAQQVDRLAHPPNPSGAAPHLGGYAAALGRVAGGVLGELLLDFVHVYVPHSLHQVFQRRLRECPRLGVQDDAVTDRHHSGDRTDLEVAGKSLLCLGVDFGEDDVGISFGDLLEHRGERPAWAAPGCPEVDEHDVVATHDGGEGFFCQTLRCHVYTLGGIKSDGVTGVVAGYRASEDDVVGRRA